MGAHPNRAAIVFTVVIYTTVVAIFVGLRMLPETAEFRPLLLFSARYTSLVLRALAFLVFAALWNAAGAVLIKAPLLSAALGASPLKAAAAGLALGPFVGPARVREVAERAGANGGADTTTTAYAAATTRAAATARTGSNTDAVPTQRAVHPTAVAAALLTATAFHPAQLTALVWVFRDSTGAAILMIALSAFTILATVVMFELVVSGGLIGAGADSVGGRRDAPQPKAALRLHDESEHAETGIIESIGAFASRASLELYHGLRVFILAGLVALALHVATPLTVAQWLHANPAPALLLACTLAVAISPPVGGVAVIAVLFRGQAPLVAVFAFVIAAFTVRGANLIALRRVLGSRAAAAIAVLVLLLIGVLLLPVADLLSAAGAAR